MRPEIRLKILVDILMTVILLLLMGYQRIGDKLHEILGVTMFVLVILHHVLNWKWTKAVFSRKYNFYLILQTITVFLLALSSIGSMLSGIVLSKHLFTFLPFGNGYQLARSIHHLSAYWGFLLLAWHLGLHWGMVVNALRKARRNKQYRYQSIVAKGSTALVALYGLYAFQSRNMGSSLFLRQEFTFYDFNEPKLFFFLDYLMIMGLCIFLSYYSIISAKEIRKYCKKEYEIHL